MAYDSFELNAVQKTSVNNPNSADGLFASLKVDMPHLTQKSSEIGTNPIKTQIHQKINTYVPADKMDEDFSTYGQAMRSYFVKVDTPYSR